MLYKRPNFKMGGSPTGIATLTPRVNAQTGFGGATQNPINLFETTPRSEITRGLRKGNIGSRFLTQLRPMSIPSLSTTGLMSLPFAPTAAMAYLNRPKTDEALKFMKKETEADRFLFDETNTDVGDFYKKLSEKNKEGESISFLDAFFLDPETGTYPKFMGRTEDVPKRIEAEKAKEDLKKFNDLVLPDARDEAKVKFSDIAEEIIPKGKKIIKDKPDEDPFKTEYDKQMARLEKYLGTNKQEEKGRVAIALSDAIGTPGTLADKASVLNKSLLNIAAGRKKDRKDLAKLAYAATVDLEKANIMAGKKSFEERRYEKLFDSAENR